MMSVCKQLSKSILSVSRMVSIVLKVPMTNPQQTRAQMCRAGIGFTEELVILFLAGTLSIFCA